MGNYWKRNLYHDTVDSRTFTILHITTETGCCLKCAKRHRREWYGSSDVGKWRFKHPSWKLVSKNRKQWMKKPLDYSYETIGRHWDPDIPNWTYCEITW